MTTKPASEELKPCPFCGGEVHCDNYPGEGDYCVLCLTGDCNGRMEGYQTKRAAIKAWNTRTSPQAESVGGVLDRAVIVEAVGKILRNCNETDWDSRRFSMAEWVADSVIKTLGDKINVK